MPARPSLPEALAALQEIPNVGPATAEDLVRLGIRATSDLSDKDPDALYERLCAMDGVRHDPCVRDVLASAVSFAKGEPARPWWAFSAERKARESAVLERR